MKIEVLETTLRDGVQAEGVNLSIEDKRALISLFDGLCFDYIEGGTPFANPKDELLLCTDELPQTNCSKIVSFGTTRRKNSLTSEDFALKTLALSKTEYVSIVGKSSLTHIEKVLDVTPEDNLKMIYDTIRYLSDNGKKVFFDAEHFFDGYKNNPDYAIDTLRTAKNAGAVLLVLCDTNGASMPDEIYDAVKAVARTFKKAKIGVHCHNDSGLAVANTMAAVEAGATHIQGTFLGFGERCGNCNLSTAILNLQLKRGYELVPDECVKKFTSAARHVAEIANIGLMKNIPYVGKSAFSHKGGMHADGVIKYPPAFEHIDPSVVGNERRFLLSDVAGRAVFREKAEAVLPNQTLSNEEVSDMLNSLKEMEMRGYQFEGADASFYLFVKRHTQKYQGHFEVQSFTTVSTEAENGDNTAKAVITVGVGAEYQQAEAQGNGPVNALDIALRSALSRFYPVLSKITLLDYKVRVINSEAATKAKVRVLITSSDGSDIWTTVGVSTDVIDASEKALVDAAEYLLTMEDNKKCQ